MIAGSSAAIPVSILVSLIFTLNGFMTVINAVLTKAAIGRYRSKTDTYVWAEVAQVISSIISTTALWTERGEVEKLVHPNHRGVR